MGNYPSFETHTGEVLDQVEANSRYLTNNGVFDQDTPVPIANVELFATNAYYWVIGNLFAQGYGTTPANATVQAILTNIQALQTTVQVEAAIPTDDQGQPNVRYRGFAAQRDQLVNVYIVQHALDQLGQSRASEKSKSSLLGLAGPSSQDAKDTVYQDDDVVQARFPRGWQKQEMGSKTGTTSGSADEGPASPASTPSSTPGGPSPIFASRAGGPSSPTTSGRSPGASIGRSWCIT